MVDDKLVSRSFWVGDIQHVRIVPTINYFIFNFKLFIKIEILNKNKNFFIGVMAERLLRSTVNTLFIGSIPINAFSV